MGSVGAVRARFRSELRRRAVSLVLLAIVIGAAGGATMSIAAAARRTASAYDRFLDRAAPSDVWIQTSDSFLGPGVDADAIVALPQVARAARGDIVFMGATTPSGREVAFGELAAVASRDGTWGRSIDRWLVVEGRRPDPTRVDEIVIGTEEAKQLGVRAGDTMELVFPTTEQFLAAYLGSIPKLPGGAAGRLEQVFDVEQATAGALRMRAKVVGVVAMPGTVPPSSGSVSGAVQLTPAFDARYSTELARTEFLAVQLRAGASLAEFKTGIEDLEGDALFLTSEPTQTKAVNRSLWLQANALRIIGAVVLFVALLVLGQALARLTATESADFGVLRALGMSRRQLFLVGLARAVAIGLPAAAVSAVLAFGASTFWPAGLAGTIEPEPGFSFDGTVIGVGAAIVFVAVVLLALWPSWLAATHAGIRPAATVRPSRFARWLGLGSPGLPARLGVRDAIEPGRGMRRVPVRTAVAVSATAIAATVMMAGFGASLTRLRDTPRLYGWTWDAMLGARGLPDVSTPLVPGLEDNPTIGAITVAAVSNLSIDGTRVDALALEPVRGNIAPTVLEGRAPLGVDEIALGTTTMRDLDVDVGDTVDVRVGKGTTTLRVVGRAVFPNFGDAAQLGRGAAMSLRALEALDSTTTRSLILVKFRADAPVARAHLARALAPYPVTGPERPDDLVSLGTVDGLAVVVSLVLAMLAAATLAHTLVTSTRRRALDLAVLKALGATRRQVRAMIGWQGIALIVIAAVIGVPFGVLAGRAAWDILATQLGVPSEPTASVLALVLVGPLVLVLALVTASGPAYAASRRPAAAALRDE
jgi:ABC-type lipoprotein release transport system permease subunit